MQFVFGGPTHNLRYQTVHSTLSECSKHTPRDFPLPSQCNIANAMPAGTSPLSHNQPNLCSKQTAHTILTFEVQPVNASKVHLHIQVSSGSGCSGALESALQIGAPAGHLHDWLHQNAVLAAPDWALVTAVIIHCTPCSPVHPWLQTQKRKVNRR